MGRTASSCSSSPRRSPFALTEAVLFTIPPEIISNDFGGFWNYLADSNSIYVVANFFLERFEFLVCSKFDHTQCGRTCACAVACLYPHNFISNVVASVTIHDDMYIYIYIIYKFSKRCLEKKKHETIVEGQRLLQPNIMESV